MSAMPSFWTVKKLEDMSSSEWESLCDGCGKCCLHKLQDEDTEELRFTCISCQYLDSDSCRCSVYDDRNKHVPDCLNLSVKDLPDVSQWLPKTCAYRLLYQGNSLPDWHPLVCGHKEEMHKQHMSVRNKTISELSVDEDDWQDYLI